MAEPIQDVFRFEVITRAEEGIRSLNAEALVSREELERLVSIPPNFEMGQASLPCFPFARVLKQRPQDIANAMADFINQSSNSFIDRAEAVSGYLNFFCKFESFGAWLCGAVNSGEIFSCGVLPGSQREKIVVEYAQPNTHKALHVGHLRCVVLGDAVSRILEYAGHEVVRATYPGDLGTHVAKILWYVRKHHEGLLPDHNHAQWLGQMYVKAADAFAAVEGTPEGVEVRAELSQVLSSIHDEEGEYFDLWKTTREWSFAEMRRMYQWLGVSFDVWYTESGCERPSVELVKQKFSEGFFTRDQGAIGIDLSEWKLGFAIFLKSDGHSLYLTKDLELMRQKFSDPKVSSSIYVVDARQQYHFRQLFKTAELMGYPQASRSVHLSYETVNTPDGKAFASRSFKGTGLNDVRSAMEAKVTSDYLERYRGIWADEQVKETAEHVTVGALKFGMLKVDNTTPVTFLLDEWLKLDGDTGPYLQYVHARCCTILDKQGLPEPASQMVFSETIEKVLIAQIARFNDYCLLSATQMRPSFIANFLIELARNFNRFYEACPIKSATGDLRNSRLLVVQATARVMAQGLALLGIPAPERM